MKACIETTKHLSSTESVEAMKKCRSDAAKQSLLESLGKAQVSDEEVESFISDGAKRSVGEAMMACVKSTKSLTGIAKENALKSCRTITAKSALMNSLGEDVSTAEVQRYLEDGARQKTRMAMKAAMDAYGSNSTGNLLAARNAAKTTLKESLGVEEISSTEFQQYLNEGAKMQLQQQ